MSAKHAVSPGRNMYFSLAVAREEAQRADRLTSAPTCVGQSCEDGSASCVYQQSTRQADRSRISACTPAAWAEPGIRQTCHDSYACCAGDRAGRHLRRPGESATDGAAASPETYIQLHGAHLIYQVPASPNAPVTDAVLARVAQETKGWSVTPLFHFCTTLRSACCTDCPH